MPTHYDAVALTGLCLAMLVYGWGNLSLRQSGTDSLENLTWACGWHRRGCSDDGPGRSVTTGANRSVHRWSRSLILVPKPLAVGPFPLNA